jgi:hypothetical protein
MLNHRSVVITGITTLLEQEYLDKAENQFRKLVPDGIKKPNLFIVPFDQRNTIHSTMYYSIVSALSKSFPILQLTATLYECGIPDIQSEKTFFGYKCVVINSGAQEKIRDILKALFWEKQETTQPTGKISSILSGERNIGVQHFNLEAYGRFIPLKTYAISDIRTVSFKHQWFYRYRLHYNRLSSIPDNIRVYLENLFENCPNHIFEKSNFHCSRCKVNLNIDKEHTTEHDIIRLAKQSRGYTKLQSSHENLQKFFLDKDHYSIATEIPLWVEPTEFSDYKIIFSTMEALTGHIDLLRIKDGKIEVWDYKPMAYNEKYAETQVFLYALMLSIRTGLPLSLFQCGYFDEIDAFIFNPSKINYKKISFKNAQNQDSNCEIFTTLENGELNRGSGLFSGKTFVLTGTLERFSREGAQREIEKRGGKVTSTVSARTNYVVAGTDPGSKLAKAEKLNVPIIDEQRFIALFADG